MKLIIIMMLLASAQVTAANDPAIFEQVLKSITSSNVKIIEINDTPIASIKEVMVDGGRGSEILYISEDGKYIINGSLFE